MIIKDGTAVINNIPYEFQQDIPAVLHVEDEAKKYDTVNNPEHYCDGAIECIDAMELVLGAAATISFCQGNAFKYCWRAGKKDGNSAEQDIAKAQWYHDKAEEISRKYGLSIERALEVSKYGC